MAKYRMWVVFLGMNIGLIFLVSSNKSVSVSSAVADNNTNSACNCRGSAPDCLCSIVPDNTSQELPRFPLIASAVKRDLGQDGYNTYNGFDLLTTFSPLYRDCLRDLRPDRHLLAFLPATYGQPFEGMWDDAQPGDPEYQYLLRDPNGNILYVDYWNHAMYNMTVPDVVEEVRTYVVEQYQGANSINGILFDRIHRDITNVFEGQEIDSDGDGLADDPTVLNTNWRSGLQTFLAEVRADLPDTIIVGNDASLDYAPWLNGRIYELDMRFISADRFGSRWNELWLNYQDWLAQGISPPTTIIMAGPPWAMWQKYGLDPTPNMPAAMQIEAFESFQDMRFALTMALMGDGYFYFDLSNMLTSPGWYDEFDNGGLEREYLGQAVGSAQRLLDPGAAPDQIIDGDFESDIGGEWGFNVWDGNSTIQRDTSTSTSGTASVKVDVLDLPASNWQINLSRRDLAIDYETEYTLSFWAKASDIRDIRIIVQQQEDPWIGYGLDTSVTLSTEWEYYEIPFVASDGGELAQLVLAFGDALGTIWLDNIHFNTGSFDLYRRDFEQGIALVNATHNYQSINLNGTYYRLSGFQAPLERVIIDDDSDGFSAGPAWVETSADFEDYGETYHSTTSSDTVVWQSAIHWPGKYEVSVWYEPDDTQTALAQYTIHHDSGMTTVSFDQRAGELGWHSLGYYTFNDLDGALIELVASSGSLTIADALKLESTARFNDGTAVSEVSLQPQDGIILLRDPTYKTFLPVIDKDIGNSSNNNMLTNGSFESSIVCNWTFAVWDGAAILSRDITTASSGLASARISVTEAADSDWRISYWQQDLNLIGGEDYTLSFHAKASKPLSLRAIFQRQVSPFEDFMVPVEIDIGTSWQLYNIPFKASHDSQGQAKIVFALGLTKADIWLDEISLHKN